MTADGEAPPAPLLVCLDALEPVSANAGSTEAPPWRISAAALLAHARRHPWPTAHVLARRPGPGEGGWRPAPGLAPLPREPVFHRDARSAFCSLAFGEFSSGASRRLVIVGCSLDSALLATVLDGVRSGRRLVLPLDALSMSARELAGVRALAAIRERHADVRLTLTSSERLLKGAADLRLIQGARGRGGFHP